VKNHFENLNRYKTLSVNAVIFMLLGNFNIISIDDNEKNEQT